MIDWQRSTWYRVRDTLCLLVTFALLAAGLAAGLGCVVPDPQGGDNAPDIVATAPPDASAASVYDPTWEARALLECDRMCLFYSRLGCSQTSSLAWHEDCRRSCHLRVWSYPNCQREHATVDLCRYTVGRWIVHGYMIGEGDGDQYICAGGWPYLTRPSTPGVTQGCALAASGWNLCVNDPLPPAER